jgi:hypothetical protein
MFPTELNFPFNSAMVKTILNNNKDATSAIMKVNIKGWVKFEFKGENWESHYYHHRKQDL